MSKLKELDFSQREKLREAAYERKVRFLPCLNSNNSIRNGEAVEKASPVEVSSQVLKAEKETTKRIFHQPQKKRIRPRAECERFYRALRT